MFPLSHLNHDIFKTLITQHNDVMLSTLEPKMINFHI